ncbi:MAG: electron transfer flavoprotein subunit beta/FixA family protein [Anaerolineales bacterium]
MRIVVCMKQVSDLSQLRFKSDGRTPVIEGLPVLLGEFEKNALEEAVRIKEASEDVQVIALAAGTGKLKESIKEALAIGADEAVLVNDPALAGSDAAASARVLAAAIEKIGDVDLIMLGEGSDDEYSSQIPSRLAELLELPQITTVRALELGEGGRVRATRDLEAFLEIVECDPPVVISATSELNTPRLPPLTAILKAGRKPTQEWTLEDVGLSAEQVGADATQIEVLSNLAPEQARKNVMLEGTLEEQIDALIRALEHEGVLS